MKVLLGIDGTEDSLRALPRTIERTAEAGDDLTIAILDHSGNDRDPDELYRRASEALEESPIDAPIRRVSGDPGSRLVDIAEDVDALLVSDEVYDHFDHSGRFASALGVDSPHRAVTTAFSKSFAITGFRVGYAVFPPALADRARTRHMLTNVTGSRPAQYAVLEALRTTDPDYYADVRATLRERIDRFTDALDDIGADYTDPEGAFYVLARFPDFPGTMANVERLIEEAGVAGMPGETFGSREEWIRFALVTPRADEAAERLAAFF